MLGSLADRAQDAGRLSPLRETGRLSELADLDELSFRDEHEVFDDPARDVVAWIERKELVRKFEDALTQTGVEPAGTVVELGAGSCWLSGLLAKRATVERVIAVEFSRRRLVDLAPFALAHVDAPAEKVERLLADFYDHSLDDGIAELVVMDAAFHHAADPERLCRIAYDLLAPGGHFLLHREPTLSLLRRTREKGVEDEFGDFERGYDWWTYLRLLRDAGFEARKVPAAHGYTAVRDRARLHPPLSWLNGTIYSVFTYVGRKPG